MDAIVKREELRLGLLAAFEKSVPILCRLLAIAVPVRVDPSSVLIPTNISASIRRKTFSSVTKVKINSKQSGLFMIARVRRISRKHGLRVITSVDRRAQYACRSLRMIGRRAHGSTLKKATRGKIDQGANKWFTPKQPWRCRSSPDTPTQSGWKNRNARNYAIFWTSLQLVILNDNKMVVVANEICEKPPASPCKN